MTEIIIDFENRNLIGSNAFNLIPSLFLYSYPTIIYAEHCLKSSNSKVLQVIFSTTNQRKIKINLSMHIHCTSLTYLCFINMSEFIYEGI